MGRKLPTKEELFAFSLMKELNLLEAVSVSAIEWDKPDIQIGQTIGVEVVQLVSQEDKAKDAFAKKNIFGKGYTCAEARELISRKCRENEQLAFLDPFGSHYISPNLPFASTASGGGFNLPPRLDKLKSILSSKVEKWKGYKAFPDKRCFVYCSDYFRYIPCIDPLKMVFSESYSSTGFDILYLFGSFKYLASHDCYALVELKINSQHGKIEISNQIHQIEREKLEELKITLYK